MLFYRVACFANTFRCLQALLSGCSAGGLSTLIHCDDFRALLPKGATIKCLADGALFLDEYLPSPKSPQQRIVCFTLSRGYIKIKILDITSFNNFLHYLEWKIFCWTGLTWVHGLFYIYGINDKIRFVNLLPCFSGKMFLGEEPYALSIMMWSTCRSPSVITCYILNM